MRKIMRDVCQPLGMHFGLIGSSRSVDDQHKRKLVTINRPNY
jgi:hypothetical protein